MTVEFEDQTKDLKTANEFSYENQSKSSVIISSVSKKFGIGNTVATIIIVVLLCITLAASVVVALKSGEVKRSDNPHAK
jgi:hypothetical protein